MARFEARGAVGSLYASFAPTGDPPSQSSGTLMSLQEGIAEPCAWYAIRFLRLCRGWAGSLYTSFAPTGDPPSQSSGTLMSLQEGIAEPRAHGCDEPFHRKSAGRRPDVPTEPPRHPNTYLSPSVSCLRYLTRVFPLRVPAQSSQAEQPAVRTPAAQPHPLFHLPGEGGKGGRTRGRGRYVPSRHQGVRRGARTGSLQELGTYRLDPSNLTQNKKPPTVR